MNQLLFEPELNVDSIEYQTSNGMMREPVLNLLNWIEKLKMNFDSVLVDNSSPNGDGNPEFDIYKEMEVTGIDEFFEENFIELTTVYFKEFLSKR